MKYWGHAVLIAGVLALWCGAASAEAPRKGDGPRRGDRAGDRLERGELRKEFHEALEKFVAEQHERRKDHYEKQMEENRDFWKTVKADTPAGIVAALKAHRETQFSENKQFAAAQEKRREDFVTSFATEHNLPQDVVDKVLARIEERYQDAVAFFSKQHDENMAFLDKLAAQSDLTRESLKAALKEHYEKQRAENKAFLERFKDRLKAK